MKIILSLILQILETGKRNFSKE